MSRRKRRNKKQNVSEVNVNENVTEVPAEEVGVEPKKKKKFSFNFKRKKVTEEPKIEEVENTSEENYLDDTEYNPDEDSIKESHNYVMRVLKNKKFKLFVDIFTFPLESLLWILDKVVSLLKFVINIGCLTALACGIVGLLILAKVYPTFQEARETAYDKLANVTRDDFQLLCC